MEHRGSQTPAFRSDEDGEKEKYMKMTTDSIARQRAEHHAALTRFYCGTEQRSGMQLWRSLRVVEALASRGALTYCNGEDLTLHIGKTALEFKFNSDETAWDRFSAMISGKVAKILGRLPEGFFVNGDPRGYALKLDNENVTIPDGMHKDWGGYGIMAPEII